MAPMADLKAVLTDPAHRQQVVRDAEQLVEDEVNAKSGLSGLAIKGAFKVVRSVRPGMVPDAIDGLLDDFAARLDPFYQEYLTRSASGGGGSLGDYFAGRK